MPFPKNNNTYINLPTSGHVPDPKALFFAIIIINKTDPAGAKAGPSDEDSQQVNENSGKLCVLDLPRGELLLFSFTTSFTRFRV